MIKFIKSPTGAFGLAYSAGDTAELSEKLEAELIEHEYAVSVPSTLIENAISKSIPESPEKPLKKRK